MTHARARSATRPGTPLPGRTQDEAAHHYAADAAQLVEHGYLPVSQPWAYGQWSTILIVVALVLCLFLIGFVILAVMVVSKPDGTLVYGVRAGQRAGELLGELVPISIVVSTLLMYAATHVPPELFGFLG